MQQAMVDNDHSLTNAALLILTLVGADIGLSFLKQWSPLADRWLDGAPLIVFQDGQLLRERANRERIDENDIAEAAREQGLESLDLVKFAVLERGGKITIIPQRQP